MTARQKELLDILSHYYLQPQELRQREENYQRPRVLVIAGPTACGKTKLSLQLAQTLGAEVVSADSMQVYRGMDIGTAKATKEEQALVPHHMIDIRDIQEPLTVVDFYHEAKQAIASILSRGRTPIIVGGSGFYIHSLIYGPPEGPPSNLELRKSLEQEVEQEGADTLYQRLYDLDPKYASTITINDKQKIVRGLEIIALTGSPVSEFSWKRGHPLDFTFHCWFIHRPRELLYSQAEERCEEMLGQGFIEEVAHLKIQGLETNRSAAQSIGYRQVLKYLESEQNQDNYLQCTTSFKQATRHYIKRQLTWFAKEPLFQWIDMEATEENKLIHHIVDDFLTH